MKNGILLIIIFILALAAAEGILRLVNIGEYSLNDRILFYSFPSFIADANNVVRYPAHTPIRTVAMYGDHIDYDTLSVTNNKGFQDDVDYHPSLSNSRNIVFIGDSFTEGIGGFRWVPELRKTMKESNSANLYSLGIGSASIKHMDVLLDNFKKEIGFHEVNVFVISNDFFRPFWRPVQKGDAMWFCPIGIDDFNCTAYRRPIIYEMNINESEASLRQRAQEMYDSNRAVAREPPAFYQQLNLYTLLCEAYNVYQPAKKNKNFCSHLRFNNYINYSKNSAYYNGVDTLRLLLVKHPEVKFRLFHIPEKGEAASGDYALDVATEFADGKIEYIPLLKKCRWHTDMYHKHDPHPNIVGYKNLLNCVRVQLSM